MIALLLMLYAGHPLTVALRDLESKGLRIVYSEDVVTRDMVVTSEPRSTEPRAILDELLREHRLMATRGPRGTLLIVRMKEEAPAQKAAAPMMPKTLAEIVVTPSRFELLGSGTEARQFLSRDEVRTTPHISDDFYRAIRRIPGAASDDISARFNIRGGEEDEAVVLLDGAEIYDPFHVKDLVRAFSTIDVETIGSVDILTGGFPAQYGGRMSGVIDIGTVAPTDTHTEVGASLLNLRALTQGTMANGRGEWLLSIRRGYLHELLELIDSTNEVDPRYYDLLGKVQWTLNASNVLSAHVLASRDNLRLEETVLDARAKASYDDNYVWLNLRTTPSPRLFTQNVVEYGSSGHTRRGDYDDFSQHGRIDDRRNADFLGVKNDSSFDLTPRQLVKAGISAKRFHARYDYDGTATIISTILDYGDAPRSTTRSAHLGIDSTEIAAYASERAKLSERFVVEAGARWETESHTPDGAHVSPRLNAAWIVSNTMTVRAAWGWFYQPQGVYELQVEDGVTAFSRAQRAEHRVVGVDRAFAHGISARVEAYDKLITDPHPRFENLFDRIILFPELRADRVRVAPRRSSARGVELLVRKDPDAPVSGWLNFTHASVVDEIDGRDVPRAWDQRNAIAFSINYKPGANWNFNVAGTWHDGWPTTPLRVFTSGNQLRTELGPLRSTHLPSYRRIDLRASRRFVTTRGTISFFVDVFNALNMTNVTSIEGFQVMEDRGELTSRAVENNVIGMVPSFGFSWQF
jgi:outer membrane cobalamin receptor